MTPPNSNGHDSLSQILKIPAAAATSKSYPNPPPLLQKSSNNTSKVQKPPTKASH